MGGLFFLFKHFSFFSLRLSPIVYLFICQFFLSFHLFFVFLQQSFEMFVKVDTVMSVVGAILIMVLLFGIGVFFLKRDKN